MPRPITRPIDKPVVPVPSPVDFLASNFVRSAPIVAQTAAANNIFNPFPSIAQAGLEGRNPTGAEAGLDAGFLAAGFLPVGKALQGLKFINRGSRNPAEPGVRYVEAVLPEAQRVNPEDAVGRMRILPSGTVGQIFVEPNFRRQGIATEMWNYANRKGLNPVHSPVADQTAAGKAWIASLGNSRPGLTVTGTGDAGRLAALVRRLNKSTDVGDFMTPRAIEYPPQNYANQGLYRGPDSVGGFTDKNLPEPAEDYLFGLVPTEKLAPLREFDRWNEVTEGPIGRGNVKKLMDHLAEGGKLDDPLAVQYFPQTGAGYLAEGNHRLAMAEQLGLEQLPTTVWRGEGALGRPGLGRNLGDLDIKQLALDRYSNFPDVVGERYIPPTMHPYLLKYFQPGGN
jgi:hypothetical protein